jgi:pyridoxamine 5'-phosphate oxidase
MPFNKITEWLNKEKELGCKNPDRAVLATTTSEGIPHSRIVAIREINLDGILFFTQRGARKYSELMHNPHASMTFWFALQQREIIIDGITEPLSNEEREYYWKTMSRERQLRFSAYAPTSGQSISSIDEIENSYHKLSFECEGKEILMSEFYCGFRFVPDIFYFYTLGLDTFSKVMMYKKDKDNWHIKMLSP